MSNLFEHCTSLQQLIGEAVGAGSVCWEDIDKAGVFKSEQAKEIVDDALKRINELTSSEWRVDNLRYQALELASRLNLMDQGTDLIIQRADAFLTFLLANSTGNLSSSQDT